MEFEKDFKQYMPKGFSVSINNLSVANQTDVFFRAKQNELIEQYETARFFLSETDIENWDYWFTCQDEKVHKLHQWFVKEKMFEASLFFYNVVIDLSWVLCYVSCEYSISDKKIDLTLITDIETAYNNLRKAEGIVSNPYAEDNPFTYLKKMNPKFSDAIDLVIDFWAKFGDSELRNLYNYIKHRGKPLYDEVNVKPRAMNNYINGMQTPTDIRDVQKSVSMKIYIDKLYDFDNRQLYQYIENLFELLEKAINPSPFIF